MSIPFYWDSLLWYSSLVRKNAVFKTPISLLLLLPFYSSYHTQKKPSFIRTWKQNGSILCDSAAYSRRSTTLCSIFMQRSIVRKCSILNLAMIDKKKGWKTLNSYIVAIWKLATSSIINHPDFNLWTLMPFRCKNKKKSLCIQRYSGTPQ